MAAPTEFSRTIAERIVYEVGAMPRDTEEAKAMVSAITRAIVLERKDAVYLTRGEAEAALDALSQMTIGNANDFASWKQQTSGTRAQWNALLSAEEKLRSRAARL